MYVNGASFTMKGASCITATPNNASASEADRDFWLQNSSTQDFDPKNGAKFYVLPQQGGRQSCNRLPLEVRYPLLRSKQVARCALSIRAAVLENYQYSCSKSADSRARSDTP